MRNFTDAHFRRAGLGLMTLLAAVVLADDGRAQTCVHHTPERQPFFGDVHVHSVLSFDAYLFDTRNGPRDAYRFARGEAVGLPPLDAFSEPTRTHQLRAPLDFAAVTDHAEMLGETTLCAFLGLDVPSCNIVFGPSGGFTQAIAVFGGQFSDPDPTRQQFCGENGANCLFVASSVWAEIGLAAEEFDDPDGDCSFTTFPAYEWTAAPGNVNLHRNVLFRSGAIPSLPLSYVEVQSPGELWAGLQSQCATVGGDCQAITIPHNSNQSEGETFQLTEDDGSPMTLSTALLRQEMEPLVELTQHKGDSECRNGVDSSDPKCDFEKIPQAPIGTDAPLAYVRNVLKAGLELDTGLGVNPFSLGLIGSSDTHNGTPGATLEDDFPGHVGSLDADAVAKLTNGSQLQNPGGLMVVWAEENSRDALFDAMLRRETYATSGTRPEVRFFGGFGLPAGLCSAPDLVTQGYANGVPMGGLLAAEPAAAAPRFVVDALQDAGTPGFPGTPLAEIEIVKGWVDAAGTSHETVYSIGGGAPPPGAVDLLTCTPDGSGVASLCAEWVDPDFDPAEHAFYSARALESPVCRWSARICRDNGVDCTTPAPAGFEACCDGSVPETIQERATTSPIWTKPLPEPGFGVALAWSGLALAAASRYLTHRRQLRPLAHPERPFHQLASTGASANSLEDRATDGGRQAGTHDRRDAPPKRRKLGHRQAQRDALTRADEHRPRGASRAPRDLRSLPPRVFSRRRRHALFGLDHESSGPKAGLANCAQGQGDLSPHFGCEPRDRRRPRDGRVPTRAVAVSDSPRREEPNLAPRHGCLRLRGCVG